MNELARILALPRRDPPDLDELASQLTPHFRREGGQMSLRPMQAWAMCEAYEASGLVGIISVGGGKTLLSLLLPKVLESRRPVLVVPGGLVDKTERERMLYATHWDVPKYLCVQSYQRLGRKKHADWFFDYRPDLIILDEAHKVKNRSAAVTKRLTRYLHKHPETKVCVMSGTFSKRSIRDYAHLLIWALKQGAPVPRWWKDIEPWAMILDEHPDPRMVFDPKPLAPLLEPGEALTHANVRKAFRRRLVQTPGVVQSTDDGVEASLRVDFKAIDFKGVADDTWVRLRLGTTPEGFELVDQMQIWSASYKMGCQFYHTWDPRPPKPWLDLRAQWARYARKILAVNRSNIDTEAQVKDAVLNDSRWSDYKTDDSLFTAGETLEAWQAVEKDHPLPSVTRWEGTEVVEAAAKWLRKAGKGSLVWVEWHGLGEAIAKAAGVPFHREGGICQEDGIYVEDREGAPLVIGRQSNSEGRNLQHHWHRNLFVVPPTNGLQLEQALGRTHRPGQPQDEVTAEVWMLCAEHVNAVSRIFRDSPYLRDTISGQVKLLIADTTAPNIDDLPSGIKWSGVHDFACLRPADQLIIDA